MPMQASQRARELERLYKSRQVASVAPPTPVEDRRLQPVPSHYDDRGKKQRPLSFVPSPQGEVLHRSPSQNADPTFGGRFTNPFDDRTDSQSRHSPVQSINTHSSSYYDSQGSRNGNGVTSPVSPRTPGSEMASTQSYPLNDIDYETNPVAVAQELSNLQAIRRMSMDVNTMDPDLPAFNPNFGVPPMAPSAQDDDEDPSRLFWVPARLHPELAPKEFKTFITERVKTIKRSSLSTEPSMLSDSPGSLRRRKSMLSRQIDSGTGYEDGSTRLQRKESQLSQGRSNVNLHDLEELVSDPTGVVRRMSVDRRSMESGSEILGPEDMPMLPSKSGMQTLKRSTRTTYRKHGSLKKPGGRRQLNKMEENGEASPLAGAPQLPDVPQLPDLAEYADVHFGLTRSNTDPTLGSKYNSVDNFSRPGRRQGSTSPVGHAPSRSATFDDALNEPTQSLYSQAQRQEPSQQSRYTNGRQNQYSQQIPQIVETPPIDSRAQQYDSQAPSQTSPERHPEQPSAPTSARVPPSRPTPPQTPHPHSQLQRPQPVPQRVGGAGANQRPANITLNDIASHPNIYPQSGNRTDSLSLIPTYSEDKSSAVSKKTDKKQKNKDDGGSRKTSWNWFSGGSSEDKEREKREREEKEQAKKTKSRLQKSGDKPQSHDTARLDVLQSSIEGTKGGRESAVFDRASIQVDDDSSAGKKRPSTSDGKRDGSFLSTLFSSSKRKSDREDKSSKSKASLAGRGLSPDPPHIYKPLRADVDYNWTRFSILEERAIYRMAHIKLANPRRELHSQVLLSNFMYSYLAKVQQMHPQIQIPASAAQKQQQRQQKQQKEEEERKAAQQREQREREMQQQQQRDLQRGGSDEDGYGVYQRYHQQDPAYSNSGVSPATDQPLQEDRRHHQQYSIPQRGPSREQQYQQQQAAPQGQHDQYAVNGSNSAEDHNDGYYDYDHFDNSGYGGEHNDYQPQEEQGWYDNEYQNQQNQPQPQQQAQVGHGGKRRDGSGW